MRIVGGIYGRRRFRIPSSFSARPTTDFAKENIFNVIGHLIDIRGVEALDLFSGTGSISFELLSRGCQKVTAVEKKHSHADFIASVAKELQTDALKLIRGDALRFLEATKEHSFDFIFADPPYDLDQLPQVPPLVMGNRLLRPGGVFVMEHARQHDFSHLPGFVQRRVYGSVNFSLFVVPADESK